MSTKKKAPAATAAPAAKAASITTHGTIRVRAIRLGYYGEERKREGDVFELTSPKHFSKTWMEHVTAKTPNRTTTSKQALAKQMGPAGQAAADADNPLGG